AARGDGARARRRRAAARPARARHRARHALSMGPQRGADDRAAGGGRALKALRIGIDARKIADFGIGTYIRNLLRELVALGDEYVAFAPAGAVLPRGVEHVVVDAPHYSVRELLAVGRAADRARLDLFHAPHYVVPLTRVPLVVTVHDLIHLRHPNPLARLYARTMIARAVRKARRVLTVSETVKGEIEKRFGARNVVVAPNGCDHVGSSLVVGGSSSSTNDARPTTYFLFVGN